MRQKDRFERFGSTAKYTASVNLFGEKLALNAVFFDELDYFFPFRLKTRCRGIQPAIYLNERFGCFKRSKRSNAG